MSTTIEDAIAAYVREQLMKKDPAEMPGLGSFGVVHERSEDVKSGKKSTSRKPPKDIIQFTPEAQI